MLDLTSDRCLTALAPVEPAGEPMERGTAGAPGGMGMGAGGICAVATPDTGVDGGAFGRSDRLLRGLHMHNILDHLGPQGCRDRQ